MTFPYTDPFDALFTLQRALDARLASDWPGGGTTVGGGFPPLNLFQKGDDFVAVIELPGVDKNDLQIEARENTIRIAGTKDVKYQENASIHRRERVAGTFDRSFTLPIEINADSIVAEYREGVLALFVPRAESQKPRTIKIK
jgi:HSP20 family protein